jgi:hypothetical protein
MKLVWICVKSPSLLLHFHQHSNFILTDELRPKEIIDYCHANWKTMDYFIMDPNRSPIRQVAISWLFNQLQVLPTDDVAKNIKYLELVGVTNGH